MPFPWYWDGTRLNAEPELVCKLSHVELFVTPLVTLARPRNNRSSDRNNAWTGRNRGCRHYKGNINLRRGTIECFSEQRQVSIFAASWPWGLPRNIFTTIRAVCKWVLTNMSFSSRAGEIRQQSSPKSHVIFAFVFSWIGDFFVCFWLIFVKLRRVCVFWV